MAEFLHQKYLALLLLALLVFLCVNVSTTMEGECTTRQCKKFECPENKECLYRICTGITSRIKCKPGSVIDIKDFMFGSVDVKVCANRHNAIANCKPDATIKAKQMKNIKRLCQNETECQLKAAFDARDECMIRPENLWGDPCDAKPKYIIVNFTCVAGNAWNYWSKWGVWDHCSTTCGNGTKKRNRTCIDSPQKNCTTSTCAKKKFPANQYEESQNCNQGSCPAESYSLQITKLISPSIVSISGEETSYTLPSLDSQSSIKSHTSDSVALKDSIALTTAAQYITSTYGFEKDSDYFGSSISFILPTSSSMFIFKLPSSSVSFQTTSQLLLKPSSMLIVSSSIPLIERPISTKIVLPSMSKILPTTALQSSSAIITIIPPTTKPEQPEIYVTTNFKFTWEEFYKLRAEFREGIAKVLIEKVGKKVDADQIILINIEEWEKNLQGEAVVKFYVKNKDKDTANEEFTKLAGQIMLDLLSEGNTTRIGKQFRNGVIWQVVVVEPSRKDDDDDDGLAVWLIVLIVIAAIIFMLWFCCCLWMFCVKKRRKRDTSFSNKSTLIPLPLKRLPKAEVNDNTSTSSADEPAELTTFSTSIVINDDSDDNDKEIIGVDNSSYENEVDLPSSQGRSTIPVVNVTLLPPSPSVSIKEEESSEEDDAERTKENVDSPYEPMHPAVTSNYDDKPPESPASNIPDGDHSDSDSDSKPIRNDGDDSIRSPRLPRSPGVTRVFIGGKLVQEIPVDQAGSKPISVKLSTLQ